MLGVGGAWLDVNTCHRRIYKPVYYACDLVIPILDTKGTRHHSGSHRTGQEGGS